MDPGAVGDPGWDRIALAFAVDVMLALDPKLESSLEDHPPLPGVGVLRDLNLLAAGEKADLAPLAMEDPRVGAGPDGDFVKCAEPLRKLHDEPPGFQYRPGCRESFLGRSALFVVEKAVKEEICKRVGHLFGAEPTFRLEPLIGPVGRGEEEDGG